MAFARFMASPLGRAVRVLAGIALIAIGLAMGGTGGIILAVVGVVPLLAGLLNVCVFAPLLRVPFNGRKVLGGGNTA